MRNKLSFVSSLKSKKFTARNESFVCLNCGKNVEKCKKSYRNHCPFCLYSLHVDINPGDRAEECGAMMKPVEINQKRGEWVITHECNKCGKKCNNKTAPDDSIATMLKISKQKSSRRGEIP